MFYRITEDCIGCGKCYENCPLPNSAIVKDGDKYRIVPDQCCDCGNCVSECDVNAIEYWIDPPTK